MYEYFCTFHPPHQRENEWERSYNDDEAFSTINDCMVMSWGMRKINLCIITHTLTHSLYCALLFTKFSTYHAWKRSNNYKQLCDEFSLSFVIMPCITMCDIISSHTRVKKMCQNRCEIHHHRMCFSSWIFIVPFWENFFLKLCSSHNELTFLWKLIFENNFNGMCLRWWYFLLMILISSENKNNKKYLLKFSLNFLFFL